ncbi:hypothetical protein ACXYMU_12375 [Pontibacter sp. CAU 1760]
MSSKKYASLVDEKLRASTVPQATTAQHDSWLVINTDSIAKKQSSVKQVERSFIPAILYWGWNSTMETELATATTIGFLEGAVLKAADSLHLAEKLQGGKLVITLREVPDKFVYQNKGSVLFLLVAYTVSGAEAIAPAQKALVASFEVQDGVQVATSGDVLVRNSDKPVRNIWKSTKKFTWSYLDLYRSDTERMGTALVQQIVQQLDARATLTTY